MKAMALATILLLALTACAPSRTPAPQDAAVSATQVALPNPASVHCRAAGNNLEIRTASDGSQYGVCIFPDGSTCDEWAFFREECGPAGSPAQEATPQGDEPDSGMPTGAAERVIDWWGVIKKTDSGAQFDDYFERQDLGQPLDFGIDSRDPAVEAQIEALRDTGTVVHLTGALYRDVPDVNGSQILVVSLVIDE